jgi:hypothetical protein
VAPKPPIPPKLAAETASLTRPASDTLLLDLEFNGASAAANPSVACTNPSIDILLNLSESNQPAARPEDPFFKPSSQVKTVSSSADLFCSADPARRSSPDLFGVPAKPAFQAPGSIT